MLGWAPLHDWVKVITQFKERFIQTSVNFDLLSETSQQSIELDLMQYMLSNISRSQAHVALENGGMHNPPGFHQDSRWTSDEPHGVSGVHFPDSSVDST